MVVEIEGVWLISTYISPNSTRAEYCDALSELEKIVRLRSSRRTIIAGDFNARAAAWDPYGINNRGHLVEGWAAGLGLQIVNEWIEPTLSNTRGASIIDLTWVTPNLNCRIRDWRVSERETLSDHRYITFKVKLARSEPADRSKVRSYPRWNFAKLDLEKFNMALEWTQENCPSDEEPAESQADWISRRVRETCDLAAPKSGGRKERRQAYWWGDGLNDMRNNCNATRRLLTRHNKRHGFRANPTDTSCSTATTATSASPPNGSRE